MTPDVFQQDGVGQTIPQLPAVTQGSPRHAETEVRASSQLLIRHYWPLGAALALSLLWVMAALLWLHHSLPRGGSIASPIDLAAVVAGIASPVIIFWLIALVYLRADPLRGFKGDFSHALHELLSPLDAAEARVNGLVSRLKQQSKNLETSGDLASDRLGHLIRRFEAQISDLFSAMTDAERTADSVSTRLASERHAFTDSRRQLEHTVHEIGEALAMVRRDLHDSTAVIQQEAVAAGERVRTETELLHEAGHAASEGTADLVHKVSELIISLRAIQTEAEHGVNSISLATTDAEARVAERLAALERETARLGQSLMERARQLEEEAKRRTDSLQATADYFSAAAVKAKSDADTVLAGYETNRDAMAGIAAAMQGALAQFTAAMETATQTLAANEQQIAASRTALDAVSGDVAHLTEKAQQELGGAIAAWRQDIRETGERLTTETHTVVGNTRQTMQDALIAWQQEARTASEKLATETRDTVQQAATNFAAIADITASLEKAGGVIDGILRQIEATAKSSHQEFQSAQSFFGGDGERMIAQLQEAADAMRTAGDAAQSRLSSTTDESMDALNRSREAARTLETEMDTVSSVIAKLNQQTYLFQNTLESRLQSLEDKIERLRAQTQTAEDELKQLAAHAEDDKSKRFSRAAEHIIEALESASIDIVRLLSPEVADTQWRKFLKGDRSIFVRHALSFGDRGSRGRIRQLYGSSSEFHSHVDTFFRDFERLLAEADKTDPKGVLTVTLVSSQVGRLYVMLAQALGRLT